VRDARRRIGAAPLRELRASPDVRVVIAFQNPAVAWRLLVVDDHAGFRAKARSMLQGAGFDVVGDVGDAAGAIAAISALRPQIVLLDVQLPDGSGFDVARSLALGPDPPAVILISSREASDYGKKIECSGALGFIWKGELSGAAVRALVGASYE
jgi:DNA-binding NarL/FixJ family response regulator